jgi:hypothetical protein
MIFMGREKLDWHELYRRDIEAYGINWDVSARRTHLVFQAEVFGRQRCGSNSLIRLLG